MSRMNSINTKKALTLRKEKLVEELKYYARRIEEAKLNQTKQVEYEESSDSDIDLPPIIIEPSITNLKIEHSALQTCFEATQELTGLQVLQSEVNVLVEDPTYDGEPPVTEAGIWREVTVECRVDLVPFSMTFYVHQPNRRFGGLSYRGLKVLVIKNQHEAELNKSILHELRRPSEAFEVLKAYCSAHRSRRTTLSQLATSHSSALHMSPLADGGYQLKCGNLLEISWTLQNKTSPVAPFHHRMKFDLDYMDEAHIQIVMAAHKALSDPTIGTDERTSLLSKIIAVCLKVQGINLPESTSESEAAPSKSDLPTKRKRDEEAMAPPRAPPKKSRPKGKENKEENRMNGKSARDNMGPKEGDMGSIRKEVNAAGSSDATTNVIVKDNGQDAKKLGDKDKKSKMAENSGVKNGDNVIVKEVSESNKKLSVKKIAKDVETNRMMAKSKEDGHHNAKKVIEAKDKKKPDSVEAHRPNKEGIGAKEAGQRNKNSEVEPQSKDGEIERVKKASDVKDKKKHNNRIDKNNGVKDIEVQNVKKLKSKDEKVSSEILATKDKDTEVTKDINSKKIGEVHEKVNERQQEKRKNAKNPNINGQDVKNKQRELTKKHVENTTEKITNQPNLPKDNHSKKIHADKAKPPTDSKGEITKKKVVDEQKYAGSKKNNLEKNNPESTKTLKISTNSFPSEVKSKLLKDQFSDRRSRDMNNLILKKRVPENTRIPQKAPNSMQKVIKKYPLRISPRKSISKLKGVLPIRKPLTHIPRLVSKPVVK